MLGLMFLAKKLTLQQDDEVRQADRQEYLLMREWLSACVEPSMFVSMPFLDDGRKKASFAQVLAVNPVVKTVEMFKEAGNEDNPEFHRDSRSSLLVLDVGVVLIQNNLAP